MRVSDFLIEKDPLFARINLERDEYGGDGLPRLARPRDGKAAPRRSQPTLFEAMYEEPVAPAEPDPGAAEVLAEVTELLEGTVLEGARVIRVSSTTGQGIDELRAALDALSLAAAGGSLVGGRDLLEAAIRQGRVVEVVVVVLCIVINGIHKR